VALLTIRDLTVEYRRAGRVIRAADQVSFDIDTGSAADAASGALMTI
jgi:ABC-type glutathione transport system ATPase component